MSLRILGASLRQVRKHAPEPVIPTPQTAVPAHFNQGFWRVVCDSGIHADATVHAGICLGACYAMSGND
eukprot:3543883-Rhodomonas_salina.2